MVKDLSNQRLPRFQAGQPLLEQVTAERLNDICTMIEACRLQPGVGYMINRSAGGTTLSINTAENQRPPKLWRVAFEDVVFDPMQAISELIDELLKSGSEIIGNTGQFASVFISFLNGLVDSFKSGSAGNGNGVKASIEEIFTPIYSLIDDIDAKVQDMLNNAMPVRKTLENYFNNLGIFPQDGDYIYTDEFGIVYTTFRETSDSKSVIFPKENLIFRVKFTLGESEDGIAGTNFYALATFPNPDVASIIKTVMKAFVSFVSSLIGASFEGLVDAILKSVAEALNALYEYLMSLIEELQTLIEELIEKGNTLGNTLDDIEEALDKSVEVEVLSPDGLKHTIKVLKDTAGVDQRKTITWIDSDRGEGHEAKALIWDEVSPREANVGWRPVAYIGTDGKCYARQSLTLLDRNQPQEFEGEVEMNKINYIGANGQSYSDQVLMKKDATEELDTTEMAEYEVCENGETKSRWFVVEK